MVVTAKEVKVPMPDTFDSTRDKLKKFILQVELYMSFQLSKFIRDSQRVLQTIMLLKGPALDQIEPYVEDYLIHQANAKKETTNIIGYWEQFKEELDTMFRDTDKMYTAERALLALRQKNFTTGYIADFRRLAVRTRQNNKALRA